MTLTGYSAPPRCVSEGFASIGLDVAWGFGAVVFT